MASWRRPGKRQGSQMGLAAGAKAPALMGTIGPMRDLQFDHMDLFARVAELGMLSAVARVRREFCEEKIVPMYERAYERVIA